MYGLVQDFTGNANLGRLASLTAGVATGTQSGKAFQVMDNAAAGVKTLNHIDDVARKVDSPVIKPGVGGSGSGTTKIDDVTDSVSKVDSVTKPGVGGAIEGSSDVLSKPSSKVLRKNLIDAGVVVPDYSNAAHHIVAGNAMKAAEARAILQKYDIDINDAVNGTFLPTVEDVVEGEYHPSLNTNLYYDEINNLLRDVTSKQEALDVLNYISESLQNGTFMK